LSSERIRRRALISGEVQGVFFRASAEREAARHHVAGWVRNLRDGRVELVVEGERVSVESMVAWAHHGPPRALVVRVDVEDEEPTSEHTFRVR
jgi:acylphosphatase